MLYTICYARHTTVYIIGIYHGILNDAYIRIYHGLPSSPTASLSPAAPLVQRSSRSCFIVWSALVSFSQSLFTPLLSLTL